MTIIISQINKFGIVFAADQNITSFDSNYRLYKLHPKSPRRKLVSIKDKGASRLGLVVGYFGLAEVPLRTGRSVWIDNLVAEVGADPQVSSI